MSSWIKRKLSLVTNNTSATNSSVPPAKSQNPNVVRFEVFKSHWAQVVEIICPGELDPTVIVTSEMSMRRLKPVMQDDVDAVRNLMEQMIYLLAEEQSSGQQLGPILEYLITDSVMSKLYGWYERSRDFKEQIAINQIKVFEVIISNGEHSLLHHRQLITPMLKLLSSSAEMNSDELDGHVVLLLNLLCVWISRDPTLLDIFFWSSEDQGTTNFIIFSLLVAFIHREGSIGQQARDALLLCVTMSSSDKRVAQYIVSTDFCPVLATGLSALYSLLPRQIDVRTEEWHFLRKQDWSQVPALVNFMNSFEFCNSVVEAAEGIVSENLLNYIYNGFLVSVFGPALHKPSSSEVVITTAYLNLFLQSVTTPSLLRCFLRFLLCHRHDNSLIMNTLIQRMGSNSKLAAVSLSLFRTLLDFDCEDLMLHLVFRYLIPCQHILASQHRSICDVDMYSASADRFISLTPKCYRKPGRADDFSSTAKERSDSAEKPASDPSATEETPAGKERSSSRSSAGSNNSNPSMIVEFGSDHDSQMTLSTSYMDYLESAKHSITSCHEACRNWSEPYDGKNPPIDAVTEVKGLSGATQAGIHGNSISLLSINNEDNFIKSHTKSDPIPLQFSKLSDSTSSPALHALNATYQALNATAQAFSKSSSLIIDPQKDVPLSQGGDEVASGGDDACVVTNGVSEESRNTEVDSQDLTTEKLDDENQQESKQTALKVELSIEKQPEEMSETNQKCMDSDVNTSPLVQSVSLDEFFRNLMAIVPEKAHENTEGAGDRSSNAEEEESEGFHEGVVSANSDDDAASTVSQSLDDPDDYGEDSMSVNSSFYEADLQYSPVEYSTPSLAPPLRMHATPYTGPFLSTLFGKLDQMPGNSLYENLLLTGIISRLSCYPQPLLRSFLLNTHVVFHPAVRSLYQVLSGVRIRIDAFAATVDDFSGLIFRAEKHLLARDLDTGVLSEGSLVKDKPMPVPKVKTRNNALTEVFLRRQRKKPRVSKLEALIEKKGKNSLSDPKPGVGGHSMFYTGSNNKLQSKKQISDSQTKNVVFACVILHELLKELAAISQEHAVTYV